MDKRLEKVIRKNKVKKEFGVRISQQDIDYLIQQAEEKQRLEEENKRYEKALNIYADGNHYVTDLCGFEIEPTAMIDKGAVARQALGGES